MFPLAGL